MRNPVWFFLARTEPKQDTGTVVSSAVVKTYIGKAYRGNSATKATLVNPALLIVPMTSMMRP
jgi:hypothetical protein